MSAPTLKLHSEENASQLPITHGSMSEFAADPVAMMRKLHEKHGDVAALQDESQRIHFVFSPEYNQQILSDSSIYHSQFFAVRGSRKSAQRRLTLGLLSMNGSQHKTHRRKVKEPFSRRSLPGYFDAITSIADELTNDDWTAGDVIDLNEDMTHYMLRVTSGMLFGLDIPEFAYEIGEMIETWVNLNHKVGPAAFASHPELMDDYEQLLSLAEELEVKIRELIRMRKNSTKPGNDVLSLLIHASGADGEISEDQLVGHVTLMFAAAHMTTAHSLTWTLFLLSQHPEAMQNLHNEFSNDLKPQMPLAAQIHTLPVLDRVIKESMRVMPASSYSQRITKEAVQLGPMELKANSIILFSQFMTHHRPDLYEDPETFNPDRWLDLNPNAYSYLPFGAGPRLCIGSALALTVMKISLPKILQRYRLSLEAGTEVNARVISTMMMPTSPIMMKLHNQDGQFEATPALGEIHKLVNLPQPAIEKPALKIA